MTVSGPSDQLKADFVEIGQTITNEWLEKAGAQGQAVIDSYKAM